MNKHYVNIHNIFNTVTHNQLVTLLLVGKIKIQFVKKICHNDTKGYKNRSNN